MPNTESNRSKFIIIEGILIILLVLFSGFLAFQNQALVKELQKKSTPAPQATPTVSPSASSSSTPTASPSATPKATIKATPLNTFAP